jgi:hypothetical protein
MARRMPHCVLKEYDESHFTIGNHFEEVLEDLTSELATTGDGGAKH